MNDFPRMLVRFPGTEVKFQDGSYDTRIVHDKEALEAALAGVPGDGAWSLTTADAKSSHEAALAALAAIPPAPPPESDAPPTRAELEAKATELGVHFDGRTTDKKLGELIAKKLA